MLTCARFVCELRTLWGPATRFSSAAHAAFSCVMTYLCTNSTCDVF